MATTMKLIAKVEVGSGGASTIEFTSIPGTYTDLLVVVSARSTRTGTDIDDSLYTQFNGSTTGYSERVLRGDGSGASSSNTTGQTSFVRDIITTDNTTANTFASVEMYIPNYAGSTNKAVSYTAVMENNATNSYIHAVAALWSNTAAITSIKFDPLGTFDQYSSAFLYGITKA